MSVQRNTLLNFLIAVLLATATSAFPAEKGMMRNIGIDYKMPDDGMNITTTEYSSNGSDALSVTTSVGFMAMFLWTLLSLW